MKTKQMKQNKTRLDNALVLQNLAQSRNKAQALIMAGVVLVNGEVDTRADRTVKEEDVITLKQNPCPYVSRGGLKLKQALNDFKIEAKDKLCLDIGVATGGFSHCFLLEGAKEVYGVDVGRGQLASEVLAFNNYHFCPNTNARFMEASMFPFKFDLAAVDVSFISLTKIMEPLFKCMAKNATVIFLIKPQFELSPKEVPHGIVQTEENRQKAVKKVQDFFDTIAQKYKAKSIGLVESKTVGMHGNIEFLWGVSVNE